MSDQDQAYDLSELIRRFMGTWIEGNVCDQKGGKVQVDLGGGVKTDYLPVVQIRAGNMKIETMPAVGEQVTVFFPCGDETQGRVLGALFGGGFGASGASDDELLISGRRVGITAKVDIIGDVTVKGNVTVTSGDVVADGISLKQHTHPQNSGNHFGGGANTSPPNG